MTMHSSHPPQAQTCQIPQVANGLGEFHKLIVLKVECLQRDAVSYFLCQKLQVVVGHIQSAKTSKLPNARWKLSDPVLSK